MRPHVWGFDRFCVAFGLDRAHAGHSFIWKRRPYTGRVAFTERCR